MCACAGVGIRAAWQLRRSERLWEAWSRLLKRLQGRLRYSVQPIQTLLAALPKEDLRALSWLSQFDGQSALSCPQGLQAEEQDFAAAFFEGLGVTDLEGQLEHMNQYAQRADEQYRTAREKYRRLGKAYAVTGVCAGLCAGLLLI